jgi:hypothetical protein
VIPDEEEDKRGNLNTFALLGEEGGAEADGGDDDDGTSTVEAA